MTTGWSPRETLEEAGPDRVFDDLTPENGFETWLAGVWKIAPIPVCDVDDRPPV